MGFADRLDARARAIDSLLCVGLDPHAADLTEDTADAAVTDQRAKATAHTDPQIFPPIWVRVRRVIERRQQWWRCDSNHQCRRHDH